MGSCIININNIDVLEDQFFAEMWLWTKWAVGVQSNSSNNLMI